MEQITVQETIDKLNKRHKGDNISVELVGNFFEIKGIEDEIKIKRTELVDTAFAINHEISMFNSSSYFKKVVEKMCYALMFFNKYDHCSLVK